MYHLYCCSLFLHVDLSYCLVSYFSLKNSLNISWKAGLLVTSSQSFCLSGDVFSIFWCQKTIKSRFFEFYILSKIEGKVQGLPAHLPCHHTSRASPINNFPHHSITFVTTDEFTLTHHHPKSTVYIMVYFWCHIFYGFRQMYDDMYPSLLYHIECFPKIPKNP